MLAHSNSRSWKVFSILKSPNLLWWPPQLPHPHLPFFQMTADAVCPWQVEFLLHVPGNTFFIWSWDFLVVFVLNSLIILDLRAFFGVLTLSVFKAHPISRRDLPTEACMSFHEQVEMHQHRGISRTTTWFSVGRCKLTLPVLWASQQLCSATSLI